MGFSMDNQNSEEQELRRKVLEAASEHFKIYHKGGVHKDDTISYGEGYSMRPRSST